MKIRIIPLYYIRLNQMGNFPCLWWSGRDWDSKRFAQKYTKDDAKKEPKTVPDNCSISYVRAE